MTNRALKCLVSVTNGALFTSPILKDLEGETTMPTHLNTDYQLLLMKDANGFSRRETMRAIFLDQTRTFDTVWHEYVVFKSVHLYRTVVKIIASTENLR